MKKIFTILLAVCALASCARNVAVSQHDADRKNFDAWVHVQKEMHPEYLWKQTELGSWILEDTPGTGDLVTGTEDTVYTRVNYIYRTLSGTINGTTYAKVAQQLGTYDETHFYGPSLWYNKGIYAGFEELLAGMRDGGRRKAVIPGWLLTYARYDSPEKYLNDSTSTSPGIFELELVDHFRNKVDWELDSIARYRTRVFPEYTSRPISKAVADSSGAFGFYYIRLKEPRESKELKDTTVYINYTGRLLNGRVFDTTIRDTAMLYGLYSKTKSYEPVSVTYSSNWADVKLSSNSVIKGFARTLSKMHPFEKGAGIFYSEIGYGTSGSGKRIPAYSPLCFEVEIVAKPSE